MWSRRPSPAQIQPRAAVLHDFRRGREMVSVLGRQRIPPGGRSQPLGREAQPEPPEFPPGRRLTLRPLLRLGASWLIIFKRFQPTAPVAQKWIEQRIPNPCVPSSSLGGGANHAGLGIASVERGPKRGPVLFSGLTDLITVFQIYLSLPAAFLQGGKVPFPCPPGTDAHPASLEYAGWKQPKLPSGNARRPCPSG
jgi:hypothetical protein